MNAFAALLSVPLHLDKQDLAFTFWHKEVRDGDLAVTGFVAEEKISALTSIDIELMSRNGEIDLNLLLDTPATLTIHHKYLAEKRHFSGLIVEAERGDSGHHRTSYRFSLMPVLYRLDIRSDCRIFQGVSVVEIAKTILAENKIENVQWEISDKHLPREYCVCYRETLLSFIERLFAEEGIFFFLRHDSEGRHTIIICDRPEVLPDCKGQKELAYHGMASSLSRDVYCSQFSLREKLTSTRFIQRDYTFKAPPATLEHNKAPSQKNGAKDDYALYDYPGRYKDRAVGENFTRNRIQATRVDASLGHGMSNAPLLTAGFGFYLTEHEREPLNRHWRLLAVRHEGSQPQALEEDAGEEGATVYSNQFTVQESTLPYRPPQARKPLVDGPQIAKVVGPPNEEIYCDEHGRIKIQFPWDRYGKSDEASSCWIRVSQNWGGTMYGHIAIPRIGHEVIVDFLEGDPDQPIVTGRTYHELNKTPYKLPDHKTKMVIRSDSHKAPKGKIGFNEISFEDQHDAENMFFHAQKDQTIKVLNNRAKRVDASQIESIGANKSIDVGGNHQEKIAGAMNVAVGGSGAGLMGALSGLIGTSGQNMQKIAGTISDPIITETISGMAEAGAAAELMSLAANNNVSTAGGHFGSGGQSLASTGSAVGGLLSKIMSLPGVMNTVIEKIKTDTIGLLRTEQIGLLKNTLVGHSQITSVGKFKKTVVGEEYVIEVGKSKMVMREDGTIILLGTRFNFTASGPVQINGEVVDLNKPGGFSVGDEG